MKNFGFRSQTSQIGLKSMLDGTAHRPFASRALVPILVNTAHDSLGEPRRQLLLGFLDRRNFRDSYWHRETLSDDLLLKYGLAYAVLFAALFVGAWVLRALSYRQFKDRALSDVAPMLFLCLVPLTFYRGGYIYDLPEVFLLTCAYLSAVAGAAWPLMILVPLAVLNKETALLLPVLLFPAFERNWGRTRAAALAVGLFLLALPGLLSLRWRFAGNDAIQSSAESGGYKLRFWDNLSYLSDLTNYVRHEYFFAPLIPFPSGFNVVLLFVAGGLLFYEWRRKPIVMRKMFLVAALVNVPLHLVFNYRDELRNLSLMFVPAYLVANDTLLRWYACRDRPGSSAVTSDGRSR